MAQLNIPKLGYVDTANSSRQFSSKAGFFTIVFVVPPPINVLDFGRGIARSINRGSR